MPPIAWILSDLHMETDPTGRSLPAPPDAFDVAVVAGDVHEGDVRAFVDTVARLAAGRPAVAVLGNHDLYGLPIDRAADVAARIGAPLGVRVLERGVAQVAGIRFCGGTLWDDVGPRAAGRPRPDLTHILSGAEPDFFAPPQFAPYGEPVQVEEDGRMRPATFADIARRRALTLDAIEAAEADVVVTHYPPDEACLARAPGATAWIHGHVHSHGRRMAGGTEVILNARQSRAFADRMLVRLEPRSPAPVP